MPTWAIKRYKNIKRKEKQKRMPRRFYLKKKGIKKNVTTGAGHNSQLKQVGRLAYLVFQGKKKRKRNFKFKHQGWTLEGKCRLSKATINHMHGGVATDQARFIMAQVSVE